MPGICRLISWREAAIAAYLWQNWDPLAGKNAVKPSWAYLLVTLSLLLVLALQWWNNPDHFNPYFNQNPILLNCLYYLGVGAGLFSFFYFAFRSEHQRQITRIDHIILAVLLIAASLFYTGSFHTTLAPNGDNAEYIINAKSLVERGHVFRLDTPSETPNALASLGLPLILAPIYKYWGFKILPMKMLIFIFCLASGGLLFIFFRQDFSFAKSAMLTGTAFTSPYLVANSNTIMTEGPYLFWSLLALIMVRKYAAGQCFSWKNYILMLLFLGLTYLTRVVGASLFIASFCYLLYQLPSRKIFKEKRLALTKLEGIKIIGFVVPILMVLFLWQLKQQQSGVSQVNIFLNFDLVKHVSDNFIALKNTMGQLLFSPSSFRWYKQSADFELSVYNIGWLSLLLVFFSGILYDLIRGKLVAFYSFFLILTILLASQTPQERVFLRYFSVMIPLLIYHLYSISQLVIDWLYRSGIRPLSTMSPLVSILLLGQIYISNLSSNRYNVLEKGAVFNAWYDSFLHAAKWCGENLPPDAYVMSIKPRIVYLFSGLHGLPTVGDRDVYSPEYEIKKLNDISSRGVTHIIVDAISKVSIEALHPVIQNHPDKFEKLPVPGLDEKCTVVKVRNF